MFKGKNVLLTAFVMTAMQSPFTASAASQFADAPSWCYQAVENLVKAGAIDGAEARAFSKDQVMTRYEMARLVGRAAYKEKEGRLAAGQQAAVDQLKSEFQAELQAYGNLSEQTGETKTQNTKKNTEKKPPVTFQAYARERIESTSNPIAGQKSSQQWFRYFLLMHGDLGSGYSAHIRYGQDDISQDGHKENDGDYSGSNLHWLYLDGPLGHSTNIRLGRQPLFLGYGLTADIGKWWDGLKFSGKLGKSNWQMGYFHRGDGRARNFFAANVSTKYDEKWDTTLSYIKDGNIDSGETYNGLGNKYKDSVVNTAAIGARYRFDKNTNLMGEIGRNASNRYFDASTGYFLQLNYKQAQPQHAGSWGTWVQYRNGGLGFDPLNNMTTLDWTNAMDGAALNGTHGWECGFSYVPFENTITTLKYWALHSDTAVHTNQRGLLLQFEYLLM